MSFQLLTRFQALFEGKPYLHRDSSQGDFIAQFVFEDLYILRHSPKLVARIDEQGSVLNAKNKAHGVRHRRGDGSFGTLIPGDKAVTDPGFVVSRGPTANVEIGIEVKIIAKAMIKQIDRVKKSLVDQTVQFRRSEARAIVAGIVGINHADRYVSFEGTRQYPTDGKKYPHPRQEAAAAARHVEELRSTFDELLILPYRATNIAPFPFSWVDANKTRQDYGAFLVRLSSLYQQRF
ncbi:MAG TPA: hypothetical protein PKB10_00670 [Tepidisphaeraceae bacterium]|nr:hypothetical protein [Tepidisphaeraceae bacterium]